VLFVLIPTAWLAFVFFGLTMCRLAALSDDSYPVALAEWIATSCLAEHEAVPADGPAEQLPLDAQRGAYRATG
jgi:hypothetical protein